MKKGNKIYLASLMAALLLPIIFFSDALHHAVAKMVFSVQSWFIDDQQNTREELAESLLEIKGSEATLGYFSHDDRGNRYASPEINEGTYPSGNYVIRDFSLTRNKITNGQFLQYLRDKKQPLPTPDDQQDAGSDTPALVTYQQASDYCQWLGEVAGKKMFLPPQYLWEYAARSGGKNVLYPTDNGLIELGRNVPSSAQKNHRSSFDDRLMPVGQFPPTPLGLYDMAANGREWTASRRGTSRLTSYDAGMNGGAPTIAYSESATLDEKHAFRCLAYSTDPAHRQ